MTAIKPLVAGNWKMHGLGRSVGELRLLVDRLAEKPIQGVDVLVCPPATLLARAKETVAESVIGLGGQDCHPEPSGAHTGDISAEMLADAGATAVIVGHSERRIDHAESDALVRAKVLAADRAGLTAILCIGETEAERKENATLAVLGRQLEGSLPPDATPANLVIAYEPVWAIGSGLTPESGDIAVAHGFIRSKLGGLLGEDIASYIRILYGGSVKPGNARDIFATDDVNGALVGGASLKAEDFYAIIAAYGH